MKFKEFLKEHWFVALAAALLVIGLVLAFFFRGKQVNAPTANPYGSEQTTSTALAYRYDPSKYPTGPTLLIGTDKGAVTVKNFYPTAVGEDETSIIIVQRDTYFISYDTVTSAFWVAVTGTPFASYRRRAEDDFLATLGISERDACRLKVTVGAPYATSPSGPSGLPLSFCL